MRSLKEQISSELSEALSKELFKNSKFSLHVGVLNKGKTVFSQSYGNKKHSRYDLASMTKAIFTAYTVINLYPEIIHKRISDLLPWLDKSDLRVETLLTHTSGLPAHEKLFLKLRITDDEILKKSILRHYLREEFNKLNSNLVAKKVYSDIGFLLLSEALEAYLKKPLKEIWLNAKDELKLPKGIKFKSLKQSTAPSEKCPWRKKIVQGEPLDGNAYVLGGVQPHAGLFGSMNDMLKFGSLLRLNYQKNKKYYMKKSEGFATGFEMPSGKLSNAGSLFSKKSIGHLGFTGTSFWYDPEADLFVCILSNRTYPDRSDISFNKYRPLIHDIVYKNIVN